MSENASDYKALYIEALKAQRDKLNEAIALAESLPDLGGAAPPTPNSAPPESTVRRDTFYGLTILEATKKFLAMNPRDPKTAPQIVEALQRGGYAFTGEAPAKVVASVLSREDAREGDVVRVGRGLFGLID